jgi:hypothetical protein
MQTASIIEHRGFDSSEAATKVVCAFLIYDERLGMLYGNHINIVGCGEGIVIFVYSY